MLIYYYTLLYHHPNHDDSWGFTRIQRWRALHTTLAPAPGSLARVLGHDTSMAHA